MAGISTSPAGTQARAAATQVGVDALIDLGNGDRLTLVNVNRADLHQDDFVF